MNDETQQPATVQLRASAKIERPPRGDGYRPISDPLWVWAAIQSFPGNDGALLILTAARRLDVGHLQIERGRDGLSALPPVESPAGRQRVHEIVGDLEMGVWSIEKAIDIALSLSGHYRIEAAIPKILPEKKPLVTRLRDHYSHIDERAFGKIKGRPDVAAAEAFKFAAIFRDRTLTDGRDSLGIDYEITALCIATRDYLVKAWQELVARARETLVISDL